MSVAMCSKAVSSDDGVTGTDTRVGNKRRGQAAGERWQGRGTDTCVRSNRQAEGSLAARGMMRAIRWYQRNISAYNPPSCKYYPSCSHYAHQAIAQYGAFRGGILAVLRLLRCRPWSRGGIDDVPQRFSIFYRCTWSRAHEEPRLTPLSTLPSSSEEETA